MNADREREGQNAEALIGEWDALPREFPAVRNRLQAIVANLAELALAGNRLDGVWPGSVLGNLVSAEVEKRRSRTPIQSNHLREQSP